MTNRKEARKERCLAAIQTHRARPEKPQPAVKKHEVPRFSTAQARNPKKPLHKAALSHLKLMLLRQLQALGLLVAFLSA